MILCDNWKFIAVTLGKLEEVRKLLIAWFSNNYLKTSDNQRHCCLSSDEQFSINIDSEVIKNSQVKNPVGVNVNNGLQSQI